MRNFLTLTISFVFTYTTAQETPANWFTLDPINDKTQGVSADKILEELKEKSSKTVIVAVIDSGIDIEHEDLKGKIWKNEDEIAENGVDDDKNGYVDDVNGWNFIGNKNGENVNQDNLELTRAYVRLKAKYEEVETPKKKNQKEFDYWLEVKDAFKKDSTEAKTQYDFYKNIRDNTTRFHSLVKAYVGKDTLTMEAIQAIESEDSLVNMAKQTVGMLIMNMGEDADFKEIEEQLTEAVDYFETQVKYGYNPFFDPRPIVGDNFKNGKETGYGNNDVEGPDASHGTHVAGIIAANRNNDIGIRGIADNVLIMPIRAVPDGDERDKDVANAIRYAVDNGAHIINMSFGKSYSYRKELVDAAVKYAESKNVLLIHAAGNDGKNIDNKNNFPTAVIDGKKVSNWLEIGASSREDDTNFVGSFSNFGKETVDLFAPGVEIYSTTPDNNYESFSGTSMAAPSASGVAAIVMSYYPELSAKQVKEVLSNSARTFGDLMVKQPGSETLIKFDELSRLGGLVNAEEAIKLAEKISEESIEK